MIKIKDLSKAERLLLLRRRLGTSIVNAAKAAGVTRNRYHLMEHGQLAIPAKLIAKGLLTLELWEQCLVARRRAKVLHSEVAKEMKVSRYWVCQMEIGAVDPARLYAYWSNK